MSSSESEVLKEITNLLLCQKTVFSIAEFAKYAGVSPSFIYKLTQAKKIRFSCPNGKLIFFAKEDIDAFLLSNPISTADDIEQQAINYLNAKPLRGGRDGKY